jgi:hypothetical protein
MTSDKKIKVIFVKCKYVFFVLVFVKRHMSRMFVFLKEIVLHLTKLLNFHRLFIKSTKIVIGCFITEFLGIHFLSQPFSCRALSTVSVRPYVFSVQFLLPDS